MGQALEQALEQTLEQALEALRGGGTILYPTDTVWGIGCDATDPAAVRKVFDLKQRSDAKSLIVLADSAAMVQRHVERVPQVAWELWELSDKPLTLVLPGGRDLAEGVLAAPGTVAIRIVRNAFCQALIRRLGRPIVSTSANVSGEVAPNTYSDISDAVRGGVDYAVPSSFEDTGATGRPSSIIALGLSGEVRIIRE